MPYIIIIHLLLGTLIVDATVNDPAPLQDHDKVSGVLMAETWQLNLWRLPSAAENYLTKELASLEGKLILKSGLCRSIKDQPSCLNRGPLWRSSQFQSSLWVQLKSLLRLNQSSTWSKHIFFFTPPWVLTPSDSLINYQLANLYLRVCFSGHLT